MSLRLSIFLLSAAGLAYEVLLIRLFAIIQWHHFAYMVISLALLGFGASGTFLSLARQRLEGREDLVFKLGAGGFAITAVTSFLLVERLPFNPLEALWEPRRLLLLGAYYLLLGLPFFCLATSIGLALSRYSQSVPALYRADLVGAAAGALLVVALLFLLPPGRCLTVIASVGLAAAALAPPRRARTTAVLLLAAAAWASLWPARWLEPRISEYKGLSKALAVPGTRVVLERSSPLGLLQVASSPRVPFRYAPGLSLTFTGRLPEQLGLFVDGESAGVVDRDSGEAADRAYLRALPSAVAYAVRPRPRVLVLGAGDGREVRAALVHGAQQVTALEYNPQVARLLLDELADFVGPDYGRPPVELTVAEARSWVSRSRERFDVIQIALLDSIGAAGAGTHALSESYLYTVEAFEDLLDRLAPGGVLAVTRWLKVPPRDSLKLFATAAAALERRGVAEPGSQLALLRSWNTTTLLVRNGPWTVAELAALRAFARRSSFDLAWLPGIEDEELNRYNLLERPYLHDGARALLGPERQEFLDQYKFDLRPATDDRPYFQQFFRWSALPELLRLRAAGGVGLLELGYLILVATLLQAAVVSAVLILLPLAPRFARVSRRGAGPVGLYFLCLGLGFLFLEMAFIQQLTRYLGHPVYAVAAVLASFLLFAGLGSGIAPLVARRCGGDGRALSRVAGGVVLLALAELLLVPLILDSTLGMGFPWRLAIALTVTAPLALLLGMPFPLGLKHLGTLEPRQLPWAWGVNGCASVVSAVLATLLAMHFGFSFVVLAAAGCYAVAALAARRWPAATA